MKAVTGWCLVNYKLDDCCKCPLGEVCVLLALAYEQAYFEKDYKTVCKIEEIVERIRRRCGDVGE